MSRIEAKTLFSDLRERFPRRFWLSEATPAEVFEGPENPGEASGAGAGLSRAEAVLREALGESESSTSESSLPELLLRAAARIRDQEQSRGKE